MNTRTLPLALAVAAALGLVACGQEEPKKAAEAPKAAAPAAPAPPPGITIMIGHVGPLTGGIAHLGKDNENGARLAVEEANAAKIQIDGKEAKFVLVAEDDQADPKVGATVAQKLVDAKVAGVVGHLNSGTSIPASPIYNQAGIPVISGSATNPKLTEQGFKKQFRVVGRDDQQGPAIASYLAANTKPKAVAIIDDATAYGAGLADEVEKTLKAAGVKVLAREKGTDKTTDWKPVLTKLKGRNPDAVFYGGMDATGGPLLKQGRELGIKAVFAFGDGACTDEMPKLAGDAAAEGLDLLAGGHSAAGGEQEVPRSVQGEVQRRPDHLRPVHLRRRESDHRGDEEGELARPGQVPARVAEDQLQRRDRPDRLRRQGRPQGRRDHDLRHEGRQAGADCDREGRQDDRLQRIPADADRGSHRRRRRGEGRGRRDGEGRLGSGQGGRRRHEEVSFR